MPARFKTSRPLRYLAPRRDTPRYDPMDNAMQPTPVNNFAFMQFPFTAAKPWKQYSAVTANNVDWRDVSIVRNLELLFDHAAWSAQAKKRKTPSSAASCVARKRFMFDCIDLTSPSVRKIDLTCDESL